MSNQPRPFPRADESTQPFWDAAHDDRLVIQQCRSCGHYNHPPAADCEACGSGEFGFSEVAGTGTIWSFTVVHRPLVAGFDSPPYTVALIELDEQPSLLVVTNLPGVAVTDLTIGARVQVIFEPLAEGTRIPQFTLAAPSGERLPRSVSEETETSNPSVHARMQPN